VEQAQKGSPETIGSALPGADQEAETELQDETVNEKTVNEEAVADTESGWGTDDELFEDFDEPHIVDDPRKDKRIGKMEPKHYVPMTAFPVN
jgi:hypothetical protein